MVALPGGRCFVIVILVALAVVAVGSVTVTTVVVEVMMIDCVAVVAAAYGARCVSSLSDRRAPVEHDRLSRVVEIAK
uniref:Putative secreted protein n=1 Tax=Anopheles darlingi TaxID=43151 RepID=A0A2M4D193_ANODA